MRTCGNCGQKKCINSVIGVDGPACQDWRPQWGRRIAGLVVVALTLLFIIILVLSAIGDHVNTGRESWELEPEGIRTFRETMIPRLVPGDPGIFFQDTTAGRFEVGRQQEAVWYDQAGPHTVPTAWLRMPSDESPYTRLLIITTACELEAEACRQRVEP